mmetsp:Transcript_16884/g.2768  ORF Transcript_16884/g.2768 Transcript_16884/m.2768 type:complete len:94 (+) Transcript_16884:415-696(+)
MESVIRHAIMLAAMQMGKIVRTKSVVLAVTAGYLKMTSVMKSAIQKVASMIIKNACVPLAVFLKCWEMENVRVNVSVVMEKRKIVVIIVLQIA